jgi:hypothetical protein
LNGANTYTLLDIYNADVAGGWGVVTHVGEMYLLLCNMVIGGAGAATKLIDNDVGFQIGVTGTRKTFETLAGSSFEMTGCILKFWLSARKTSYGTWKFKNCSVFVRETEDICLYMRGNQDHARSEFDVIHWYSRDGTCSYNRCLAIVSGYFYYYTSGIVDDLTITGNFFCHYNTPTLKNSVISGSIDIASGINCILINSTWGGSLTINTAGNYLADKWEFNVLVTDKDNNPLVAAVELKDKNGVVKHSADTGADGKLATTWEVLANRYDGTSETKTEYNPFTLTVTKAGYADYESKITIDHIVKDDQVVLDALTYTYDEIMDEIKKVKGICLVC